jgi:hypothetical protein
MNNLIVKLSAFAIALSTATSTSAMGGCQSNGGVGTKSGDYASLVLKHEGGPAGYGATSDLSSATGAFQVTYKNLKRMGYISSGPKNVPAGAGEWAGVTWSGKGGINSRADFLASEGVQNAVLSDLTQSNINGMKYINWGTDTVGGVTLTKGGAGLASHFLGGPKFKKWASCGFQSSCLDPTQAAANNLSIEEMQKLLEKRVAEGGGVDPGCIDTTTGTEAEDFPPAALMEWSIDA